MCELLVGLPEVRVLGVVDVVDAPVEVVIEQFCRAAALLELRPGGVDQGAAGGDVHRSAVLWSAGPVGVA